MNATTRSVNGRHERLAVIISALTADMGMEEIATIIVRQGMAELGASGAGIAFLAGDKLYRMAAVGSTARSVQRLAVRSEGISLDDRNPSGLAVLRGEEVWITDRATGLERFPHLRYASTTSQGWLALPLRYRGRPFGSLSLSFRRPPVFDPVDEQFIRTLGDIAALALAPIFEATARGHLRPSPTVTQLSQALLDARTDGLVAIDSGGTIVQCNDRLCRMLGYEASQLIGHSIEVLLPLDQREEHVRLRSRYVEDPVPRPSASGLGLVALRADGTELPVEVALSPCTTSSGLRTFAVVRPRPAP